MTEIVVNGTRVRVGDGFLSLSPGEQERVVEEIAASLPARRQDPALSQVNLGIADAVGGLIDFINPFDTPAVSEALGMGDRLTTGSARDGLVGVMQRMGAAGEDRAPEGVAEAALRGGGQAAGAMIPVAGGVNALRQLPGIVGGVADDLARGMATRAAPALEVTAGAVSGAAERAAEDAGLPEWAQGVAAVAAPAVALPAATYAMREAPRRMPMVRAAGRGAEMAMAALAPYTRRGAEAVARQRMQTLAGGRERAMEMGENIQVAPGSRLTPAQQTGDDRMIALEQLARRQDPELDARLRQRADEGISAAREEVAAAGGSVRDAQEYLGRRRAEFVTSLRRDADAAIARATERARGVDATRTDGDNSLIVMEEIDTARRAAVDREAELWAAVPMVAQVPTDRARAVAEEIAATTARAQAGDIPQSVRALLLDAEGGLGEATTVRELHGLYSALREEARNAMAGTQVNRNRARIANAIADAILEDLGAIDATTAVGRAINDARLYSAALHETFDRGAYSRLSRRTVEGDVATDPELALERTVGRGGATPVVSARQLEQAGAGLTPEGGPQPPNPRVRDAITDYIRGQFHVRAFDPEGAFTRRGAAEFMRRSEVLLQRYPELRAEIDAAVAARETAEQVADRVAQRIAALEDARRSATAGFIDATEERAVRAILDADNPARAAQAILNAARRDPSGQAVEGVKAAFSDELIRRTFGISGGRPSANADEMQRMLQDPRVRSAMTRVFDPAEMRRFDRIVSEVRAIQSAQRPVPSIGESMSGAQAPRLVRILVRIVAAQNASRFSAGSGAGGSLQTAQIASGNARDLVDGLTADRATRILIDAIEDPRLFQALLLDPASPRFEAEALPRLVPYLVGGAAASVTPDE